MKYGDTPLDMTSAKKQLDWYADALSKMPCRHILSQIEVKMLAFR